MRSLLILLFASIIEYSDSGRFFCGFAYRYLSIMLLMVGFLFTVLTSARQVGQVFCFCIQSLKHEAQKLCRQGITVTHRYTRSSHIGQLTSSPKSSSFLIFASFSLFISSFLLLSMMAFFYQ